MNVWWPKYLKPEKAIFARKSGISLNRSNLEPELARDSYTEDLSVEDLRSHQAVSLHSDDSTKHFDVGKKLPRVVL